MRGAKPSAALAASVARTLALRDGETLAVAVSGGPDSVALAALCTRAANDAGARVVLAHVNHGVRAAAWQDEALVLALGTQLQVPVAIRALVPGARDEARLRDARYEALATVARENGASRVAVAHHARDQTETVLLALFRGTGPDGLGGMAAERELGQGLTVVRPLLEHEPEELREFCLLNHHAFVLDATNVDTSLRRNAVRALLDAARPQFPGLDAAVARCAAILRDERAGVPRAAVRKALRAELSEALGDTRDVTFERIDALAEALERGASGRHHVRRGVEAVVE